MWCACLLLPLWLRRFPIQLELLAPEEIPSQIMQPSEYRAPANVGWLYEQGLNIEEVSPTNRSAPLPG